MVLTMRRFGNIQFADVWQPLYPSFYALHMRSSGMLVLRAGFKLQLHVHCSNACVTAVLGTARSSCRRRLWSHFVNSLEECHLTDLIPIMLG